MNTTKNIELTIIIPFLDEEESIPVLADEIQAVFQGFKYGWECLWIDDGSSDTSVDKVRELMDKNTNHRLLQHTRNFGQSAALITGFKNARGHYLATMDADLQNDPADIIKLYNLIKNDQDIAMINGVREKRNDSLLRKVESKIANGFRNLMTRSTIRDVGCSLRIFTNDAVKDLPIFKGMHRFLPTLVELKGLKTQEENVNHRSRYAGQAKYGIANRLWVGIVDTMAVRWMQSRFVYPQLQKDVSKGKIS